MNFAKCKLKLFFVMALATVASIAISCSSYRDFQYMTDELEIPTKVFKADYAQTWQAVLSVMKSYDLELQNQEAGIIKTRWVDNTLELNFADSFGSSDAVKSARFKVIVNVIKGFRGSREVTKVTVFKRQMVNHDFLTGWKVTPSDQILEETILYRIERTVLIDNKLKKIEEHKSKEQEASF
ncbi:MAG: hypothetical protein A2X86_07835 [Bdellovibrionales bacterium GWA2_49_15]|nr:MAG: hypothetical protein A2X86_07835 [Bdellovibrionales bacterium GWA2_49_15]HAZ11811.1 hypothetical protein [Bdellovibrionales bacterium]